MRDYFKIEDKGNENSIVDYYLKSINNNKLTSDKKKVIQEAMLLSDKFVIVIENNKFSIKDERGYFINEDVFNEFLFTNLFTDNVSDMKLIADPMYDKSILVFRIRDIKLFKSKMN